MLGLSASAADAAEPAPYDVTLTFDFSRGAGDMGFREELELQLLSELRRAGCFRSVELEAPEPPDAFPADALRLRVTVTEVFEQTTRDVSTAVRTSPNPDPTVELAFTALFRARLEARLEHPAGGEALRAQRLKSSSSRRPRGFDDNPRDAVRTETIVDLVRNLRAFACKGGASKLRKELGR